MDPSGLLRADAIERAVVIDILERAIELQDRRDERLAQRIIYELAEALKR